MHDFKLYKNSKIHINESIETLTDTGYLGLQKIHGKTEMPKKKSKYHPLTKVDKARNKELSSQRVLNERPIQLPNAIKLGCSMPEKKTSVGVEKLSDLRGL
jgi:hypothetical protein